MICHPAPGQSFGQTAAVRLGSLSLGSDCSELALFPLTLDAGLFSPFRLLQTVNPYNFAALSQVILRLSASGIPAKAFSTNSREFGNVDAWCG